MNSTNRVSRHITKPKQSRHGTNYGICCHASPIQYSKSPSTMRALGEEPKPGNCWRRRFAEDRLGLSLRTKRELIRCFITRLDFCMTKMEILNAHQPSTG